MPDKKTNALNCDTITGVCEMPAHAHQSSSQPQPTGAKKVKMVYFTDPICSACWCIEPQLRRLKLEYGNYFEIEYHMGGLLPSWEGFNGGGISKPADVAHHWEAMAGHFGMPIDGSVWLEDPLASSYPPCIAYKAAELQGKDKASKFLRRIKEMVFLEKKNIAKWEHLQSAAAACGIDTVKMRADYNSEAPKLFQEDLKLAQQFGVRGFPAIYFTGADNQMQNVYGYAPYSQFEDALKKLIPGVQKTVINKKAESLFSSFSSFTTKEYSSLMDISDAEAANELSLLVKKGQIEKFEGRSGAIWKNLKFAAH